jgi:hypothetical protein
MLPIHPLTFSPIPVSELIHPSVSIAELRDTISFLERLGHPYFID